jgi:hypothetical protein
VCPAACSLLPGIRSGSRKRFEQLRGGFGACGHRLLLGGDGMTADRAELGIGGECAAALRAADDGGRCGDGTSAVGAEVRPPYEWGPTGAARSRSRPAYRDRRYEKRVELPQSFIQREQLLAPLDEEVLTELVAAEHLQHQPAEIAQALFSHSEQRTALLPELTGMRQGPPRRTRRAHTRQFPLLFAAKACQQRRPRHAGQCNSEV